jgi:hypothetical protein
VPLAVKNDTDYNIHNAAAAASKSIHLHADTVVQHIVNILILVRACTARRIPLCMIAGSVS